jgi:hypothetical protein
MFTNFEINMSPGKAVAMMNTSARNGASAPQGIQPRAGSAG